MSQTEKLNVICVQYQPKFKNIEENIKFLTDLLSKYTQEDKIDIVVFPEMTLTGYNFDSVEEVLPYTSLYTSGPTFDFCSELSKRLECYVFLGYPEKTESGEFYNSCMITNRKGESLLNYRKHFLYDTDKNWCKEGDNFGYLEITSRTGKVVKLGIGICMDINPYEFKASWEDMEFGNFCLEKDVDVIVFLANWIDPHPNKNSERDIRNIINYWGSRLEPITKLREGKNRYFLAANRTGKEKEVNFIGCSCILKIAPNPSCLKNLNKIEEKEIKYEIVL